jgi:hypothetical protein
MSAGVFEFYDGSDSLLGRKKSSEVELVQLGGLEPPTSCSTDRRSNQLSYNCILGARGPKKGVPNGAETRCNAPLWQGLDNRPISVVPAQALRHAHIFPSHTFTLILRSRAVARRLEGWPGALVADPSRRGQRGRSSG